jgi:hypothetical protein
MYDVVYNGVGLHVDMGMGGPPVPLHHHGITMHLEPSDIGSLGVKSRPWQY